MTFTCQGLLFDLDGTLVSSIEAVNRSWSKWCRENNLDPEEVLPRIHGRRAIDSLRDVAPHLEPDEQFRILERYESEDTEGVHAVPGAPEFIRSLGNGPWGIVTSGTKPVAEARRNAGGIPLPETITYGEEISEGKPAPDAYLRGAEKLGLATKDCIAFEDAAAGVESAARAGCRVILVTSEEAAGEIENDLIASIKDFREITAVLTDGHWRLTVTPKSQD